MQIQKRMLLIIFLPSLLRGLQYSPDSPDALIFAQGYNEDSTHAIWDLQLMKSEHFEIGQNYAFSFWCRWSSIAPVFIPQQSIWHSIARLTTILNHHDHDSPEDKALSIQLGQGFFQFTTYTDDSSERFEKINYSTLDGNWNFIYYSYSYITKLARGYLLESDLVTDVQIPAKHRPIQYLHFLIKREFQNLAFNGFYSRILFQVDEPIIETHEELYHFAKLSRSLPDSLFFSNDLPNQQILLEGPTAVRYDKLEFQQFIYSSISPTQYSISGWLKYEIPIEEKDNHLIFRLTLAAEFSDDKSITDRLLYFAKQTKNYYIESYSCAQEQCTQINWKTSLKDEENMWHFLYIGYNQEKARLLQFGKFISGSYISHADDVHHYLPYGIYIQLQKDHYSAGFNGQMKQWVFNYGLGSYTEHGFENDQLLQKRIGLQILDSSPKKLQRGFLEDNVLLGSASDLSKEVLLNTENLSNRGLAQYGYGLWFKFVYNGPRQIFAIDKIGVAKMTTIQSSSSFGNIGLSILLKPGNVDVLTYTLIEEAEREINIEKEYDGRWIYAYVGYQRYSDREGIVNACVYDESFVSKCHRTTTDIIHFQIEDYLLFQIGQIQNYQIFNGEIMQVEAYFGKESLIPIQSQLQSLKPRPIQDKNVWILKQLTKYDGDHMNKMNLSPFEKDFLEWTRNFGVELWFKEIGTTSKGTQTVFKLTSNNLTILEENQKPGDMNLGLQLDLDLNLLFNSYHVNIDDSFQALVKVLRIEHKIDRLSWKYLYFGHDDENICFYFLQTRSTNSRNQFLCRQHSINYLALFLGHDNSGNQFNGIINYVKLHIGENLRQFYYKSEVFEIGINLFPTAFKWQAKYHEIIELSFDRGVKLQTFASNEKYNLDGQSSYGFGLWTRFFSKYPKIFEQIGKSHLAIASLTISENLQEHDIISVHLIPDLLKYEIRAFDQLDRKYKATIIESEENLEGIWSYIYLSYTANYQEAVGFVCLPSQHKIIKSTINNVHQDPLGGYAAINLGKFGVSQGFNGLITNIFVIFDGEAFIHDPKIISSIIKEAKLPHSQELKVFEIAFNPTIEPLIVRQIEFTFPEEYSIYGWFRPDERTVEAPNFSEQILFDFIGSSYSIIMATISQNGAQFQTYSTNKNSEPISWMKNIPHSISFGAWTYFWIGYSHQKQQLDLYYRCTDEVDKHQFSNIKHYYEKKFQIVIGSIEGKNRFLGKVQQFGLSFGSGSYKDSDKIGELPQTVLEPLGKIYLYQHEGRLEDSQLQDINLIKGHESLIGSMEYSIKLWTRWLQLKSRNYHHSAVSQYSLFRLSRGVPQRDCMKQGDKILMVALGARQYEFITYDRHSQECSLSKEIDCTLRLEGHWNLVYFGYKTEIDSMQARGFVYFSEENKYHEVEFYVEHAPLGPDTVLSLGRQEFQYGPFIGQIQDLYITIGYGYEKDLANLIKQTSQPLPDSNEFIKHNLIDKEESINPSNPNKFKVKVDLEKEYGVFGWFKNGGVQDQGNYSCLIKLGTNDKKTHQFGDQTFLLLINQKHIKFQTYTLEEQILDGKLTNEIEKTIDFLDQENIDWTFFYLGYSYEKSLCSIYFKFSDTKEYSTILEHVYHYLPFEFWLSVGIDPEYSKFTGQVDDINLIVGQSSFAEEGFYQKFGSLNRKYVQNIISKNYDRKMIV